MSTSVSYNDEDNHFNHCGTVARIPTECPHGEVSFLPDEDEAQFFYNRKLQENDRLSHLIRSKYFFIRPEKKITFRWNPDEDDDRYGKLIVTDHSPEKSILEFTVTYENVTVHMHSLNGCYPINMEPSDKCTVRGRVANLKTKLHWSHCGTVAPRDWS